MYKCLVKCAVDQGDSDVLGSLFDKKQSPDGYRALVDTSGALSTALGGDRASTEEYLKNVNSLRKKYPEVGLYPVPSVVGIADNLTDGARMVEQHVNTPSGPLASTLLPFNWRKNIGAAAGDNMDPWKAEVAGWDIGYAVGKGPAYHLAGNTILASPEGTKNVVNTLTENAVGSHYNGLTNDLEVGYDARPYATVNSLASHEFNHALNNTLDEGSLILQNLTDATSWQPHSRLPTVRSWRDLADIGTPSYISSDQMEALQSVSSMKHLAWNEYKKKHGAWPTSNAQKQTALIDVMRYGAKAPSLESNRWHNYMLPYSLDDVPVKENSKLDAIKNRFNGAHEKNLPVMHDTTVRGVLKQLMSPVAPGSNDILLDLIANRDRRGGHIA